LGRGGKSALSGRRGKAHDGAMDVQLVHLDGCPHGAVADKRLRSALASLGRGDEAIDHVLVGRAGPPTLAQFVEALS
jgi:hypothetical protein